MKRILSVILIITAFSCLRLDSLVFLGDTSIHSYLFDNYPGEVEIQIPDSYNIPDSLIKIVTFESRMKNENSAVKLYGVYIGHFSKIQTDTVILYCHGQKDHMDYYWTRAKLLANTGGKNRFGIFMFDYRGYGLSEGIASEDAMYADVKGALDWLADQGCNHIVLYGFSLGSAPATYSAAFYKNAYPIEKLILESPFASADFLSQKSTFILTSASYMTDLKLSNAEWIKQVNVPFLWFHGEDDDYISIENGEIIFNNYQGPYKEAHRVKGALHGKNGVPETLGFDNYLNILNAFISR